MTMRRLMMGCALGMLVLSSLPALAEKKDSAVVENGQEINLAVGESRTISARDVKNYSEGVPGIVELKLTTDNNSFVINGRRPGSTTLLLIKNDGTQVTLNLNVFLRNPQTVEKELNQLLGGMQGVSVRRMGARFLVDGTVASDADFKRVQHVVSLYPDQVDSLVQQAGAAATVSGAGASRVVISGATSYVSTSTSCSMIKTPAMESDCFGRGHMAGTRSRRVSPTIC